mmetsp:Transcript_27408/g.36650  ORF Transcript_27408/g.36650 Transcript_27408/m.36650 type:complete len:306 (-) Transcript_27408:586-1503(-)
MIDFDENLYKDFDAAQHMNYAMLTTGFDEPRVMMSNLMLYVKLGSVICLSLLALTLRMCCWKLQFMQKCTSKFRELFYFNFFIRLTLESILEVAIKFMITLRTNSGDSTYEQVEYGLALGSLIGLLAFALAIPVFLTCKRSKLGDKSFQSWYGSLTEDLRIEETVTRFHYPIFITRRLMISALIVFWRKRLWAQVQLITLLTVAQLIYVGSQRPYSVNWMNQLELANEFLVLLTTYFHFLYTDGFLNTKHPSLDDVFVKDAELASEVSQGHIALLALILSMNFFIMLSLQVINLHRKAKLRYLKQ